MREPAATRSLVEGALLAALTALLALIGIYIPPLQFVTNLVWTLPIIVLIIRNDVRIGVMATIISGLLVFLFSDPTSAAMLFLQFGGVGIVYGVLFKKQASAGKTLFYGTLVALVSTVVALSFSFAVTGINIVQWQHELEGSIGSALEIYRHLGLLEKLKAQGITEAQLTQTFKMYVKWIEILLPGIVVVSSMFAAFINFVVARVILRKLSFTVPDLPPFSKWRLPWYSIWGFILGLSLFLIGQNYHIVVLNIVGKNILYIYFPLLLIMGISVVTYFFKSEKTLPFLKGFAIFLLIINLPLAVLIILSLGLFDTLLDYRKLERRN